MNRWLPVFLLGAAAAALLPLSSLAFAAEEKEEVKEIEDKMDKDQPPVTAGGLYNIDTFPIREIDRTLTLPMGVLELKANIRIDISEGVAFKRFTPVISAKYGVSDTLQLEAGVVPTLSSVDNEKGPKAVYAAAEIALMYDLVDARVEVDVPFDPKTYFDIALGVPFKFRLNDKIAAFGLERLLIIHTANQDTSTSGTDSPDLNVSVGAMYQVIDPLVVMVRASLFVGEFKFSEKRKLPIDLDIQYSVSNVFDVGIGVSLTNIAPPESIGGKATDSRELRVFGRFRI